ncbi:MAG TPA: hypothetical protein VIQ50_00180 [Xanthobacteraceae bacterium]
MTLRNILLLGLASLICGCESRLGSDEAGLIDAVAFVTGGQQEGDLPQGFETRWRRTVEGRAIRYETIRQNPGFGEENDPHRGSRHVKVGVSISSPQKCVFKTVIMTAYSRGGSKESFEPPSNETTTLDFNKVQRIDIEDGDRPSIVIDGKAWQCKDGKCQDRTMIGISAPRPEDLPRVIESKRRAVDFITKSCLGTQR